MEVICLNTNILIAHKRATLKYTTILYRLLKLLTLHFYIGGKLTIGCNDFATTNCCNY